MATLPRHLGRLNALRVVALVRALLMSQASGNHMKGTTPLVRTRRRTGARSVRSKMIRDLAIAAGLLLATCLVLAASAVGVALNFAALSW
jgi:preprotein translocase subunit SecG